MSPVIFTLTAMQARALIDLYQGREGDITARLAQRLARVLIARGLAEQSGAVLMLTPIGYHAAQLALALDARTRHEQAARASVAELHQRALAADESPQAQLPLAA